MDPNAVIFIRVIILAIGALGVLLLVQSLLLRYRSEGRRISQSSVADDKLAASRNAKFPWKTVSLIFCLIIVYLYIMQSLGFYASALLYFLVVIFLLDSKKITFKVAAIKITAAVIFIAVIYVLFNKVLLVQTPRGLLM